MSILSDWFERVRSVVLHRRDERDLDEELQFHLQMEIERNVAAGLDATEARRRALLTLGGVEQTKEQVRDARGTRLFEDSRGDVAYSMRTLVRRPGFAAVVILTLAIGIGGTTAVFSAVDAVLLKPLPYASPGELVRLYMSYGKPVDQDYTGFVTPVHYLAYRSELTQFESSAAIRTYDETGADIGGAEHPQRIRLLPASAGYFHVLRTEPELGREFRTDEENGSAAVVVLSHALWEREFAGDRNALGKTFMMNGKPYTVIGVARDGFADPLAGAVDAWVPFDLSEGRDASNASNHYLSVIARLRPGVSIKQAQSDLDMLSDQLAKQYGNAKDKRARLVSLKDDIVGPVSRGLELVLGAVALLLLLACVNIANLLLVRASERAREFALRSALGAGRPRLVRQLLIESLTLALIGDIAGLALARIAMSAIVRLGAGSIPRLQGLTLEPRVLVFSVLVASCSAIVFGLAPALHAARTNPNDVLRQETRAGTETRAQRRLRAGLVVSQVALAYVLVVGSGLLIASLKELQNVRLGVKTAGVLAFQLSLPEARYDSIARAQFYEDLAQRVASLPGVHGAGGVSKLPATGSYNTWGTTALTGPFVATPRGNTDAEQRIVSGNYFQAVGIPLLSGRTFDGRDTRDVADHVIISRSLADILFAGVDPVGQRLHTGGRDAEVIGVVPDIAVDAEGRPGPFVYHAHAQFAGDRNWALTQVVATDGAPESLVPQIRRTIADMDPQLVMHHAMPLAAAIGEGRAQRVFTTSILSSFAAVALILAALGLFGVLSYTVKLRGREFGIRLALGAERGAIQRMVLRQGLIATGIGIAVGLVGAVALARLMAPLVFQISPLDPRVMGAAALFMCGIATLAAYLPAHSATSIEPRSVLQ